MVRKYILPSLLALVSPSAALSLPLPPPPPNELAKQKEFFQALPQRLPPEDFSTLANYVAPDVKVYREGKLRFDGRDQWFEFLRSFAGKTPQGPQGLSVSKEAFYRTRNGAFVVLEFLWPIPPKGEEGEISYHSSYDFNLVTYYLDAGRLVRVDYGPPMRKYEVLLECPPKAQAISTDFCDANRR